MTTYSLAVNTFLGFGTLLALSAASHARGSPSLKEQLQSVAERRIFFGHQSVGANLLEGLRQLAEREGVALRVVEATTARVDGAALAHVLVEENGDPMKKLWGFAQAFHSGPASGSEVALLKFCYADITADTNVSALFAAYQKTVAEVQASNPGTQLVHVTAPLQVVEGGLKGWAKRMLGRPLWGTAHNARREEFNEMLRRAYGGKAPIFDLARVESTRPEGGEETAPWNGGEVRALVPAYTDDGGHLNERGRLRAARELVAVLSALPRRGAPSAAR